MKKRNLKRKSNTTIARFKVSTKERMKKKKTSPSPTAQTKKRATPAYSSKKMKYQQMKHQSSLKATNKDRMTNF